MVGDDYYVGTLAQVSLFKAVHQFAQNPVDSFQCRDQLEEQQELKR